MKDFMIRTKKKGSFALQPRGPRAAPWDRVSNVRVTDKAAQANVGSTSQSESPFPSDQTYSLRTRYHLVYRNLMSQFRTHVGTSGSL